MNLPTSSYHEDFARMVSLMGLALGDVPTYKIESESVPKSRYQLMGSGDLPSVEEAPDELKWIIKQTRQQDERNQEELGLMDILGFYKSAPKNVVLHELLIQLVALKRGWSVEALRRIVHWHELAHAATHLGLDGEKGIWKGFAFESADVKEYFAQIYTFKMLVETGDSEALKVMQEFTPRQPSCYQTYLPDKEKALKKINLALLEARRRAPARFPHFEQTFSSSWGIEFDGIWQELDMKLYLLQVGVSPPEPPKHGSSFHISGLKIKIKSYDYRPTTSVLNPEVAHRLYEVVAAYLTESAPVEGPNEPIGKCWHGEEQRGFSLGNESSDIFWREVCDALALQLPTFANLLRDN
jgi:hypothetical protein